MIICRELLWVPCYTDDTNNNYANCVMGAKFTMLWILANHVPKWVNIHGGWHFYSLQQICVDSMLGVPPQQQATMPVSSCEAERSFSALRRIKNYMRTRTGQDRLSSLTLLHLERDIVNKVIDNKMDSIIDEFGSVL